MGLAQPTIGSPDLVAHTGFILAEDEALKAMVSGITLPERPGSTEMVEVGVWFRFPEGERQIHYPFITLDLITVEPAYDLFQSVHQENPVGLYRPSVAASIPAVSDPSMGYSIPNFLPFRLIYQIMVHCRSSLHDRYLLSLFMTDLIQPRPFWLGVDADQTWRRIERVGFAAADIPETTESGTKRIFRKAHTVSILAEVPQSAFVASYYKVLRVFLSLVDRERMDQYYEAILKDQPDPLGDFTAEERAAEGELSHVWHEGRLVPPAGAPPPG